MWRWAWGAAFTVQAALLFWRLDVLPVWGDEQFTLDVIALSWGDIPGFLKRDIHPPLYYFLAKAWLALPIAGSEIVRLRSLSALGVLATTLLLAYKRRELNDWMLPALWAVAPALILYGRIGRSYSLQLLLSSALIFAALRFLETPRDRKRLVCYCAIAVALLYVHYLPGTAIVIAVSAFYLRGRDRPLTPIAVSWAVIALAYLPWAWTFLQGVGRVAVATPYQFGSSAGDLVLRLGYLYGSFHFGEALPGWGLAAGLLVGAALLIVYWRAPKPDWSLVVVAAAGIAFVGAWRWVAFAFMPGRLMFLYAFWLLFVVAGLRAAGRMGRVLLGLMLAIQIVGLNSYFGQKDFFNKAYLIPFESMAAQIAADNSGRSAAVLDYYNSDPKPLMAALSDSTHLIVVGGVSQAPPLSEVSSFETVWIARSTNDLSPRKALSSFEEALGEIRECSSTEYLPYNDLERWALSRVGRDQTHHYRLVRCGAAKP